MPLRRHEQIAVFYKKLPKYRPQFTEGQPLHGRGKAYKDKAMKNQNYGEFEPMDDVRCGSTEKYPTSIVDGIHSFDELASALHLTVARQKQYEALKNI